MGTCQREAAEQLSLQNANGSITTMGRCLDVTGGGTTSGTLVQFYTCNSNAAQVWVQQPDGTLMNPQSRLCLTDPGGVTTNGTQLDIEACVGSASQKFAVTSGHPIKAPGAKCVDVWR